MALLKAYGEQPRGSVESCSNDIVELEVGTRDGIVEIIERFALLLREVAPIPRCDLKVPALRARTSRQGLPFLRGALDSHRPNRFEQLSYRCRRLGHCFIERIVRITFKSQQTSKLRP